MSPYTKEEMKLFRSKTPSEPEIREKYNSGWLSGHTPRITYNTLITHTKMLYYKLLASGNPDNLSYWEFAEHRVTKRTQSLLVNSNIIRMYNLGYSYSVMSKKLGIKFYTLSGRVAYLQKIGLLKRRRPFRKLPVIAYPEPSLTKAPGRSVILDKYVRGWLSYFHARPDMKKIMRWVKSYNKEFKFGNEDKISFWEFVETKTADMNTPKEDWSEMIRMYQSGMTVKEIADRLGNVKENTVGSRIRRLKAKGLLPERSETFASFGLSDAYAQA